MKRVLGVFGAGIATDGYVDIHALAREAGVEGRAAEVVARAQVADAGALAGVDPLTRWGLAALHQAITMAGGMGGGDARGETALLVVTAWGMVDATVAYLDSMLEADGRYASPRHFTRSVYSAAASALAIHFGIHGSCQTLAFDERESAVDGALAQAWRLVAAGRAERAAIVWAEQGGAVAADLAERAARDLGRREFLRYGAGNLGEGAVAVIVGAGGDAGALGEVEIPVGLAGPKKALAGKAFPMDGAVGFLAGVLSGKRGGGR